MRVLLGLFLIVLLGACNRVHSDKPLFFAEAGPEAPGLRDGLWVIEEGDNDCRFDARKPVGRWPDCADWMLVRGGAFLGYDKPGEGKPASAGEWTTIPYVLAPGAPLILQIAMVENAKVDHQYFAVEATTGPASAITGLMSWPVLCGPPPPKAPKGETPRFVTLEPLPGMTVVDDSCTATVAETVRNAAGPSRAWAEEPAKARWIRDSYP